MLRQQKKNIIHIMPFQPRTQDIKERKKDQSVRLCCLHVWLISARTQEGPQTSRFADNYQENRRKQQIISELQFHRFLPDISIQLVLQRAEYVSDAKQSVSQLHACVGRQPRPSLTKQSMSKMSRYYSIQCATAAALLPLLLCLQSLIPCSLAAQCVPDSTNPCIARCNETKLDISRMFNYP